MTKRKVHSLAHIHGSLSQLTIHLDQAQAKLDSGSMAAASDDFRAALRCVLEAANAMSKELESQMVKASAGSLIEARWTKVIREQAMRALSQFGLSKQRQELAAQLVAAVTLLPR